MTIHIICSQCGSTDVYADATARWNAAKGEWIMGTVHDDRYCDCCGCEAELIEIDEAEGLEIGLYGMVNDGEGARLVEDYETPDFFDVVVRTTALESGDILTLLELANLPMTEASHKLDEMAALFPAAPTDLHMGILPAKGKWPCRTSQRGH